MEVPAPVVALPLHAPIVLPCRCCGLRDTFTLRSQSDQVVCERCRRHGQDENQRLALHRDWWIERENTMLAQHSADAARWHAAADELERKINERDQRLEYMRAVALRGYESTPLGGIKAWLQEGIVLDAESKMRGAYRSRDRVMGTIWRLDRLHHESKSQGVCSCGKKTDQCREFSALTSMVDLLDKWESKQIDFLDRGLEHNLPPEHPEVVKRRRRGWVA